MRQFIAYKNNQIEYCFLNNHNSVFDNIKLIYTHYLEKEKVNDLHALGCIEQIGVPGSEKGGIDKKYSIIKLDSTSYLLSKNLDELLSALKNKSDIGYYWDGNTWSLIILGSINIVVNLESIYDKYASFLDEALIADLKRTIYKLCFTDIYFENIDYAIQLASRQCDVRNSIKRIDTEPCKVIESLIRKYEIDKILSNIFYIDVSKPENGNIKIKRIQYEISLNNQRN